MTWYPLTRIDDSFFDAAPIRIEKVLDVPVPADRLWAELEADDAVSGWSLGATKTAWVTPKPYGVGTVREITLGGVQTVREEFYRWDVNKRMSFSVIESNRPGIAKFGEDYIVEETATGSRLTWIIAVEPGKALRPGTPLLKAGLSLAIGDMVRGLAKKF